jgi:hypothetical protein
MYRSSLLLFALLVTLSGGALRAAIPLVRLAGADTTALFTIDDLGTLQKNWQKSPFGKTWNDPQVVKFLAPLREVMQIDDWDNRCRSETGKSVDELVAGFGSLVLVVGDVSAAVEDGTGKTPPALLLAVDLRDNRDAVLKSIEQERKKSQQPEVTEEFQGETLHLETLPNAKEGDAPICWVITGNVLLLGPGKPVVQKALADYRRGGAESPYVETDRYREDVRQLPDAQIRFHVDMERVMVAVRAAAARKTAKQAPNPQGMTPEVIMNALGLDTFRVISLACQIGEKDSTMVAGVTYDQPRGLARLFAASTDGKVPDPTFLSGDWASVSAARFRIGVLYDAVEEIVRGLGPGIDGMFQAQVASLNKKSGIDLKRDIFGNFGDEFYSAAQFDPPDASAAAPVPKQKQLIVFSLNDAKAFEGALESLQTGLMGPAAAQMFLTRDYLGTTIHTMIKPGMPGAAPAANAAPAQMFSYAVTQRHWVLGIGNDDLVEMAIQNLSSPQPSYWSRPSVKAALDKLPAGATGYGYADLSKLAPTYFDLFAQGMLMSGMRVKDGHIVKAPPPAPRPRPMPRPTKDGPPAPPSGNEVPAEAPAPPPADPGRPIVDMKEKPSADTIARYWSAMTSANYHDAGGTHTVMRLEYPQ